MPVDATASTRGPLVVRRELAATGNPDTIDVEFVSLDLFGTASIPSLALSFDVEIRAGVLDGHGGFFPGLSPTAGQIQEKLPNAAGNPNGDLDVFPANSFFDVFFDVWVDLDGDDISDVGEVLRSVDALRMEQMIFELPPPVGTIYMSTGVVLHDDPLLYQFGASVLDIPLDLAVVFPNGSLGPIHAQLLGAAQGSASHKIPAIPAPATLALFGLGLAGLGFTRQRKV